jgi:raffinose/stachyose/melibiose transport system permease protein
MSAVTQIEKPDTDEMDPKYGRSGIDYGKVMAIMIGLSAVAVTLAPLIYIVLGGFRTTGQLAEDPAGLPDPWVFFKYRQVLTSSDFWHQMWNSILAAAGTTAGVILLGTMAAYPLARYQFKLKGALYVVFTLGLMFPIGVAALPLYLLLRDIGLLGSIWGVIIPQVAFQLPITIIIMRPFLKALPKEVEEAAEIDGLTRVGFFWRILIPLAKPAILTVGVLAFVASWNAYLLPLLVLQGDAAGHTLPLGVQQFQTRYSSDTAAILAYTSLAMLPALAFFTLMERRIVDGLTGAVKG